MIITSFITLYKLENTHKQKVLDRFEPVSITFYQGLKQVLLEQNTRWFTIFVFLSMTAYFMQEPILEPYAGLLFLNSQWVSLLNLLDISKWDSIGNDPCWFFCNRN